MTLRTFPSKCDKKMGNKKCDIGIPGLSQQPQNAKKSGEGRAFSLESPPRAQGGACQLRAGLPLTTPGAGFSCWGQSRAQRDTGFSAATTQLDQLRAKLWFLGKVVSTEMRPWGLPPPRPLAGSALEMVSAGSGEAEQAWSSQQGLEKAGSSPGPWADLCPDKARTLLAEGRR